MVQRVEKMAYIGATAGAGAAAAAAHNAAASALCLAAPLLRVSPADFIALVPNLFTIVHVSEDSHNFYFGRFLDRFVVYTKAPQWLKVPVDVEAEKITKTIRL
jgi:hypothetical protein